MMSSAFVFLRFSLIVLVLKSHVMSFSPGKWASSRLPAQVIISPSPQTSTHVHHHNLAAGTRTHAANHNKFRMSYDVIDENDSDGKGNRKEYNIGGVPRLHADVRGLLKYAEKEGGTVFATVVNQSPEGWTLKTDQHVPKNEVLVSIPKRMCIFSDPDLCSSDVSLDKNAERLIKSLDPGQWRTRLAIALLSERVRPTSQFRAYIRNLPFEFLGTPVFYSSSEFNLMQDLTMMVRTRDRCKFLSDFADNVLAPLYDTKFDPFSGHQADVNAFGWGFATASSRAFRNPAAVGDKVYVMVPLIDMASHSFTPSCKVVDSGDAYVLLSLRDLDQGEELTIDYGPLSNEELLADYGFTVENNVNDKLAVNCDEFLFNTARMCVGQIPSPASVESNGGNSNSNNIRKKMNLDTKMSDDEAMVSQAEDSEGKSTTPSRENDGREVPSSSLPVKVGRGTNKWLTDRWLHNWQVQWLQALRLRGPNADFTVVFKNKVAGLAGIDGRLWAFLRIVYASSEEELLRNGYDPWLIQQPGSMISAEREAEVLKTMIGILAVMLRSFGTSLDTDIQSLRAEMIPDTNEAGIKTQVNSDDIVADVHKILRSIFNISPPPSFSPTVRRSNARLAATTTATGSATESTLPEKSGIRNEQDGDENVNSSSSSSSTPNSIMDHNNDKDFDMADIETAGSGLPVNVREALKFRIRKKANIHRMIQQLAEKYRELRKLTGAEDDLTQLIQRGPQSQMNKIRELLDDVPSEIPDLLQKASRLSQKWSAVKGLEL